MAVPAGLVSALTDLCPGGWVVLQTSEFIVRKSVEDH